jgi:phosphopantetheinyl transferase (holo-ACP synthase)
VRRIAPALRLRQARDKHRVFILTSLNKPLTWFFSRHYIVAMRCIGSFGRALARYVCARRRRKGGHLVGNDVVDLSFFDLPLYRHVRHLERVCAPDEERAVRQSECPSTGLAVVWAAKEAAYKLVSQPLQKRHFAPREFVTDFAESVLAKSGLELRVSYRGRQANVNVTVKPQWVHAMATFPGRKFVCWRVRQIANCAPHEHPGRAESEAARVVAKELLADYGHEELLLEFAGRIPTLRRKSGNAGEMGVSLSHHGAFAAAAVVWPSGLLWEDTGAARQSKEVRFSGEECCTCIA